MPLFTDQTGRKVNIPANPERIISAVPSQTELLVDLGLENRICGITKFCIHPPHVFNKKTRVGGTKTLNLDKIRELKPDLIICNKEENLKEQVETLAKEFPVWISDIFDVKDSIEMIGSLGDIMGVQEKAAMISHKILQGFEDLSSAPRQKAISCLYLVWKGPWMAAGGNTFIDHLLKIAGFKNIVNTQRYPVLTDDALIALDPEVVMLSSEPYPFKDKHIREIKELLPGAQVILVDGELFSWYGSRLIKSPAYLGKLRRSLK